jgi:hypothetical protein
MQNSNERISARMFANFFFYTEHAQKLWHHIKGHRKRWGHRHVIPTLLSSREFKIINMATTRTPCFETYAVAMVTAGTVLLRVV